MCFYTFVSEKKFRHKNNFIKIKIVNNDYLNLRKQHRKCGIHKTELYNRLI